MSLVPDDTVDLKPEGCPDGDEIWVMVPVDVKVLESRSAEWVKERLGEVAYDSAILQIAEEGAKDEPER
jgi:hypothetical protein